MLVDASDPEDVAQANQIQDRFSLSAGASEPLEPPDYDEESFTAVRTAVLKEASQGLHGTHGMFGRKEDVDPHAHLLGTAGGWGGLPEQEAYYESREPGLPVGRYTITAKDVPVDAFWSITVYGADGFLHKNALDAYSVNSVFGAYTFVNIWQNNQLCGSSRPTVVQSQCYQVRDPLDLAVLSAAISATCIGFLWWNAKPARIIMGDVGSLAIGGALAGLAITSRTELLMAVIAGLFVLEAMSVLLQMGYFKLTKRITGTGQRIFRIAPIHHHFEHLGWDEVTVVIRFWLIAGICVATGLAIFYASWLA